MRLASLLAAALTAASVVSMAQTTFHDPKGRYEIQVPAGWQAAPDDAVDQVVLRNGAVSVTVMVILEDKSNPLTPKEAVDATRQAFQAQCPTFQDRKSGNVSLAGSPGIYSIFTCSDPKSPAVAEYDAALTTDPFIIGITNIAPLSRYYTSLPTFDAIRDSLRLRDHLAPSPAKSSKSPAMIDLEKACAVGSFAQEDCARRIGILLGQENAGSASPTTPLGNIYQDGSGRFSLTIPDGWTAKAEGDNGSLGVQLRSGSSWINVMPAPPAATASEVVLHHEGQVAARSNSSRKPPFGEVGLIQIFGNGLELTYDSFGGSSSQGVPVMSYVGGVADIHGAGPDHLLIVCSFQGDQVKDAGVTFLAAAQSIRLHHP